MLPFAEEVCLFLQLVLEVNHLDGCHCTFVSLVAQASAGTVFGLLHVVGGNQTVNHRDVGCGIQVGDALGSTGAHIVEVRSVATNHTADGNHGIHLSAWNHLCGTEGQFKTARYMLDEDILFLGTVSLEGLYGSRQQGTGDVVVPFGHHNAETHLGCIGYGIEIVVAEVVISCCHYNKVLNDGYV